MDPLSIAMFIVVIFMVIIAIKNKNKLESIGDSIGARFDGVGQ